MRTLLSYFPPAVAGALAAVAAPIEEVRLAPDRPCMVFAGGLYFVQADGNLTRDAARAVMIASADFERILDCLCGHSVYAVQDKLRRGFLTVAGGHRVGVCGQIVAENGQVTGFRFVTAITLRIARQMKGVADALWEPLFGHGLQHTVIISPPGCGKTTLLRDLTRLLAGAFYRVGIVDERSELAACKNGVPQNDVGLSTVVLDQCPKAEGMQMLIRSMAPDVIVTDETGGPADSAAIRKAAASGVCIVTSVHGDGEAAIGAAGLSTGLFRRMVILSRRHGAGTVEKVIVC